MLDKIMKLFGCDSKGIKSQAIPTQFQHQLNDASTSELIVEVDIPEISRLKFSVDGYKSGAPLPGTKSYQAANCFVTVGRTIDQIQEMVGTSRPPIRRWPGTSVLRIVPNAGNMLNAYYDRRHLKFFWEKDPITGQPIHTANSTDIVAHELGHALLDAMRPDFWSVQALEIWSFHEAFADITAMLSLMQHDLVLHHALEETDGDLHKSNVISRLAEEMGTVVKHFETGQKYNGPPVGLRDAVNDFKYINPKKLPKDAPRNKLAAECHSFGRIFAGAWYDLMVGIYKHELKTNAPIKALRRARNTAGIYLMRAIPQTPRVARYHDAIARSMLSVDRSKGGRYQDLMRGIWEERNLIQPKITMLSNKTWGDVVKELKGVDEVSKTAFNTVARVSENKLIRLSDVLPSDGSVLSGLSTVDGHNLADIQLEVASDSYYEFDRTGVLVEEIKTNEEEMINDAQACVSFLLYKNDVGDTAETRWEISDGKLQRTFID